MDNYAIHLFIIDGKTIYRSNDNFYRESARKIYTINIHAAFEHIIKGLTAMQHDFTVTYLTQNEWDAKPWSWNAKTEPQPKTVPEEVAVPVPAPDIEPEIPF